MWDLEGSNGTTAFALGRSGQTRLCQSGRSASSIPRRQVLVREHISTCQKGTSEDWKLHTLLLDATESHILYLQEKQKIECANVTSVTLAAINACLQGNILTSVFPLCVCVIPPLL